MTVEENEDVVTLDDALDQAQNEITEDPQVEETQVDELPAEDSTEQEVIEQIEALQANEYMTKEQKELFDLLASVEGGRDHQQRMLDRFNHNQSQYSRLANDNQQLRKSFDPINTRLQKYQQEWNMKYGSTEAGFNSVMEMYDYATQDPVNFSKWLLQQNGKSLDELQESQEWEDPALAKIRQENEMLKRKFEQFETNGQRDQEQRQENERLAMIDSYRQVRDGNGNPKYPLFDQVLPSIMQLAQTEPHLSMDQAYGRIVGEFQNHFGSVAQPPQQKKIVTSAVDKTKAGKGAIKSKTKSGEQANKSLDNLIDDAIAAAN